MGTPIKTGTWIFEKTTINPEKFWTGFYNDNWNGSFHGVRHHEIAEEIPWCANEPGNTAGNEYCVHWLPGSDCLHDMPCDRDSIKAICEIKNTN